MKAHKNVLKWLLADMSSQAIPRLLSADKQPQAVPNVNVFKVALLAQRDDDFLGHFFSVREQHHRLVTVEQLVLHTGIACGH